MELTDIRKGRKHVYAKGPNGEELSSKRSTFRELKETLEHNRRFIVLDILPISRIMWMAVALPVKDWSYDQLRREKGEMMKNIGLSEIAKLSRQLDREHERWDWELQAGERNI